ncbi:MAG: hypothetical protein JWQ27_438 [Ferruginibacter sp.]|nr:hypothetical protein [Ferruginibacter sp.]
MQEKYLFEYAVIRVVPQVEREEFVNVGVVLFCSKLKFLGMRYQLDVARLQAFSPLLDIAELHDYLKAFEHICIGGKAAGPIGLLPTAERFRWLTATRSTVVQTSKVHPGFCTEGAAMLDHMFTQMVS